MSDLAEVIEYLDGKSIALLGNSESLFYRNWTNDINAHDIVWRMNKGTEMLPHQLKKVGKRCEIYSSGGKKANCPPKRFSVPFPTYRLYIPSKGNTKKKDEAGHFISVPTTTREQVIAEMNEGNDTDKVWYPSSGLIVTRTIMDLFNFKHLTLFGFDFFKTSSWNRTWKGNHYGAHDPELEKIAFKKILSNDNITMIDHFGDPK